MLTRENARSESRSAARRLQNAQIDVIPVFQVEITGIAVSIRAS